MSDFYYGTVYGETVASGVIEYQDQLSSLIGTTVASGVITLLSGSLLAIEGETVASGEMDLWELPNNKCWVWTSRIGQMVFTLHESGEVTQQPMSWSGYVYAIKKLGGNAIVYGKNGISIMTPHGVAWRVRDIWPIGLKGKNCACNAWGVHKAIDRKGNLLTISGEGQIEKTDYSQWFSSLGAATVMSYDPQNQIIYISDGTYGYTLTQSGLGGGPVNITGFGFQNGTTYSVAPAAVTFAPFAICTDIIDFGTREEKTITQIDLGLYAVQDVYVQVDYRWNKAVSTWNASPWVKADFNGHAYVDVKGVEFRIRIKQLTYEAIRLDYVNAHVPELQ